MNIDELLEEFDFLDDWEERCEFLIDLGMELPKLPGDEKVEANRVHGCQSSVWMVIDVGSNGQTTVDIRADSDAMIVRGLIAVLLTIFSGRTPQEILDTDVKSIFSSGLNFFPRSAFLFCPKQPRITRILFRLPSIIANPKSTVRASGLVQVRAWPRMEEPPFVRSSRADESRRCRSP